MPLAGSSATFNLLYDGVADPELPATEAEAIAFYMASLAPGQGDPDVDSAQAARGSEVFDSVGCDSCHVPELDGVRLYSDLLLHDVADPFAPLVDQEGDAARPREFRTPPLWGIAYTGPYLHDGSASSLQRVLSQPAHVGSLTPVERSQLVAYLRQLE